MAVIFIRVRVRRGWVKDPFLDGATEMLQETAEHTRIYLAHLKLRMKMNCAQLEDDLRAWAHQSNCLWRQHSSAYQGRGTPRKSTYIGSSAFRFRVASWKIPSADSSASSAACGPPMFVRIHPGWTASTWKPRGPR